MIEQGARRLAFLGRSGASSPAARDVVEALRQNGAEVQLLRGDVAKLSDVQSAVAVVRGRIGGVVHAAMNLKVN